MKPFILTTLWLERLLGALFILAAFLKALDLEAFAVQVSYYRVVTDPAAVRAIAYGATAIETLVGVCLIAGVRLRGVTYALTAALLIAFTGLVGYAWQFHGLEDCGCFGKFVAMGPQETILKNIAMLAVTGLCVAGWRLGLRHNIGPSPQATPTAIRYGVAVLSVLIVAGAAVFGGSAVGYEDSLGGEIVAPVDAEPRSGPYARFVFERGGHTYDLGRGTWLVVLLSADCEHCMAAVPEINDLLLFPDMPPAAGLMFGNAQEVDLFRALTAPDFPTFILPDQLAFFELIGPAPPRLALVSHGALVAHWDEVMPPVDAVLDALVAAGEAG